MQASLLAISRAQVETSYRYGAISKHAANRMLIAQERTLAQKLGCSVTEIMLMTEAQKLSLLKALVVELQSRKL